MKSYWFGLTLEKLLANMFLFFLSHGPHPLIWKPAWLRAEWYHLHANPKSVHNAVSVLFRTAGKKWRVTQWISDWTLSGVKNIPPMKEVVIRMRKELWRILRKRTPNATKDQCMSNSLISCVFWKNTFKIFFTFTFVISGKVSALAQVHPHLLHHLSPKKKIHPMTSLTKMKAWTGPIWVKGNHQDLKEEGHVEDLYV